MHEVQKFGETGEIANADPLSTRARPPRSQAAQRRKKAEGGWGRGDRSVCAAARSRVTNSAPGTPRNRGSHDDSRVQGRNFDGGD